MTACDRVMSHTFTSKGKRRYRYYVCTNAVKRGRRACPSGSLPAGEIERVVVDQIHCIGQDPALIRETLKAARSQATEAIKRLNAERVILERGVVRCHAEIKRIATKEHVTEVSTTRIAELYDQIGRSEKRRSEIDEELAKLEDDLVTEADVTMALADFETLWANLSPKEQARVIELLVASVAYDAAEGEIEVSFHPAGIKALGGEREAEALASDEGSMKNANASSAKKTRTPTAAAKTAKAKPTKEAAA